MKKKIGIFLLVAVLAAGAAGGVWYFKFRGSTGAVSSEDAVFVDSVGMITGLVNGNGLNSKFSGVVEPQQTEKVELASGMKVDEIFVEVGQTVQIGTKLFSYDTEEAQDSITQLEIDIENADISIESANAQIKQLEKEREKVSADEKLSYTTQIMTTENSIKRSEYEKKSKQAELDSLKKQIENAVVYSQYQGIIKTINKNAGSDDNAGIDAMSDSSEDSSAFMTIMETGDYRVKGKVNEQNMSQIQEGLPVIVHSRVDENMTWRGTLTSIDKENATTNQSSSYMMMGSSDSMSTSSSYPFYVDLESSEGLMLGQHVYIVMDEGQEDTREGLWLEEYYFITDEDGAMTPYVWAATGNDKLEKRQLTLGDYDEEMMKYEVKEGLTADDYIAYPSDDLEEGMPVTRNIDQVDDGDTDDGEFGEFGMDPGEEMGYGMDDGIDYGGEMGFDEGISYMDDMGFEDAGFEDAEVYDLDK